MQKFITKEKNLILTAKAKKVPNNVITILEQHVKKIQDDLNKTRQKIKELKTINKKIDR